MFKFVTSLALTLTGPVDISKLELVVLNVKIPATFEEIDNNLPSYPSITEFNSFVLVIVGLAFDIEIDPVETLESK